MAIFVISGKKINYKKIINETISPSTGMDYFLNNLQKMYYFKLKMYIFFIGDFSYSPNEISKKTEIPFQYPNKT